MTVRYSRMAHSSPLAVPSLFSSQTYPLDILLQLLWPMNQNSKYLESHTEEFPSRFQIRRLHTPLQFLSGNFRDVPSHIRSSDTVGSSDERRSLESEKVLLDIPILPERNRESK